MVVMVLRSGNGRGELAVVKVVVVIVIMVVVVSYCRIVVMDPVHKSHVQSTNVRCKHLFLFSFLYNLNYSGDRLFCGSLRTYISEKVKEEGLFRTSSAENTSSAGRHSIRRNKYVSDG